jgi:hypothetical protein
MLMALPPDYLPKAIAGLEALAKTECATRFQQDVRAATSAKTLNLVAIITSLKQGKSSRLSRIEKIGVPCVRRSLSWVKLGKMVVTRAGGRLRGSLMAAQLWAMLKTVRPPLT